MIEETGLSAAADRPVRTFSTGMRRRGGLAVALLADPALLILDEPANGLDPEGIRSVRDLVGRYRDRGRTVILSSHILGEIDRVCDRLAVLRDGAMVFEGTKEDLGRHLGAGSCRLRTGDDEAVLRLLEEKGIPVRRRGDGLEADLPEKDIPSVVRLLVERHIDVFEAGSPGHHLEDLYFSLEPS